MTFRSAYEKEQKKKKEKKKSILVTVVMFVGPLLVRYDVGVFCFRILKGQLKENRRLKTSFFL